MKVISIAATCLAAVCLASHLTMAQYQSSPYSQKKMAPVPSSMSQMTNGNYGAGNNQQQSGYDSSPSASPAMMGGASQYNDMGNMATGAMSNYGSKSQSASQGYGSKSASQGYGKQGYGEQEKPMPYMFGFESDDGYGTTQDRHEVGDARGEVKGSYGYKDPAGIYRQVEYTAGASGFNAVVKTNEPGVGSTENPADVQYIVETPPEGSYATKSNNAYSSSSDSASSSNYGSGQSESMMMNSYGQQQASGARQGAYGSGNSNMAAASQAKSYSPSSQMSGMGMGAASGYGASNNGAASMMMMKPSQMTMATGSSGYGAQGATGKVSGQAMVNMMVNSQKKAALNYGGAQRAQQQQSGYGSMMGNAQSMAPASKQSASGYESNNNKMMSSMGSYGATAALMDTDTDAPTYNSQMDSNGAQQQQQDSGASYDDSAAPAANMMAAMDQGAMSGYGSAEASAATKGGMASGYGSNDDSAMTNGAGYGEQQQMPQQFMMSGFETPLQSGKSSTGYGSSSGSASSAYGGAANNMAAAGQMSGYSMGQQAASGTKSGSNYGQSMEMAPMNNKYGAQNGAMMMAGKYGAQAMMGGAQKSMAKLRQYQQIPVHPKMMAGGDSSSYGSPSSMMSSPMEQSNSGSYGAGKTSGQQYGNNNNNGAMMMMSPQAGAYNGAANNKMALSMIKMLNNNRKSSMAQQQMKMDSQSYGGASADMASPAYTKS